jgi:hypothetical protein
MVVEAELDQAEKANRGANRRRRGGASVNQRYTAVDRGSTAGRDGAAATTPKPQEGAAMSSHRLISKSLTIGLAAAALGVPPALAGPPLQPIRPMSVQEKQVLASRGQGAPVPQSQATTTGGDGFDWGSAVIGAGAAGGLSVLVAVGALGVADHRRVRVAR